MKTLTQPSIAINARHIENSKNFQKRVLGILPDFIEDIEVIEAGMERSSGYGQYNYFIEGSLNGEFFRFKKHTTSSQEWDWYNESETNRLFANWKKNLIISMLEDYFNTL